MTQLNTILLQNLEARLRRGRDTRAAPLNERFEVRSELLRHRATRRCSSAQPTAMLEASC